MHIRKTLIVLTSALAVGTAAAAALKDKPPDGVKLSGSWRLDPERSDDPAEAIDRAARNARADRERAIEDRRSTCSGLPPDRPWGREEGTGNGPYGGGLPSGPVQRDERCRSDPFPDRDDTLGRGDRRGSSTIDPTGGGGSVTWGTGTLGGAVRNEFLLQLDPSPDLLTILDSGARVSVSENKLETNCAAGEKAPIADSFGDGERRCGWNGRAWVIETTRTKRFKRTDRFELQKGGQVLRYTTTATGQQMPPIKISRTYTLMPPAP